MDETLGRTTAATGATGAGAPRHRAMAGIGRVAIAATAALLLVGCSSGGDVAVPDVEPGGAAMSDGMRADGADGDGAPGDGAPAPTRGNGAGQGTGPEGAPGGPNPTRGNGEPQPAPGAGDSGPSFPAPPRPAPPGPEIPASELNLAGIRDCEQGAHTWRIISGDVSCAEATDVGLRYQEALREGVGTGAGEHVYVDDWTCTTPSDARARELGAVAECTRPDGSRVHELKK